MLLPLLLSSLSPLLQPEPVEELMLEVLEEEVEAESGELASTRLSVLLPWSPPLWLQSSPPASRAPDAVACSLLYGSESLSTDTGRKVC